MNPDHRHDTTCYIRTLLHPTKPRMLRMAMPSARLHSSFALEQLTELARRSTAPQFVMLMAPVFGFDLPARVYIKLQQSLCEGTIEPPLHRISHEASDPADYDNRSRTISIHSGAFDQLLQAPERAWELLAVLLHEFGHHVDNVLRQDLADDIVRTGDAQGEEGMRYARAMARCAATHNGAVCIARYTLTDADEAEIVVDCGDAMQAIARFQGGSGMNASESANHREGFEAGSSDDQQQGHFSHEVIEAGLAALGFTEDERQTVYFGNWLRDYSQLLDPKIVRGANMPKDFPDVLSRSALTRIVDVLAARKFNALRKNNSADFTVTEEKLGVYRPSEHVDNPAVINPKPQDPKTRDADFEPWVLPDDPLLEVVYQSSMKRYLHNPLKVMRQELVHAMRLGRTPEGLQRLGAALHVLEDLFAHSNFVELSLIKLGHKVLPWTSKADCKHQFPLVTGTFSGADVIGSLAYPVAKLIAPVETPDFSLRVPGELSDNEKMTLILLDEHQNPEWLYAYTAYLEFRDLMSQTSVGKYLQLYWKFTALPLQQIKNVYGTVFQAVFKMVGNSIDDVQSQFGDPNSNGSTDPSHSQLAKDHAEHPFHELAANLAGMAVINVVKAVVDHWNGVPVDDPVAVASAYFTHPNDSQWQDETIEHWAATHPDAIRRGGLKSELDKVHQQLRDSITAEFTRLGKEGMTSWQYIFSTLQELLGIGGVFEKDPAANKDGKFNTEDFGKHVIQIS
jgi:hypothetical protein